MLTQGGNRYLWSHDALLMRFKDFIERYGYAVVLNKQIDVTWETFTVISRLTSVDLLACKRCNNYIAPVMALQLSTSESSVKKIREKIFSDIIKALPSKAPIILVLVNLKKFNRAYAFWELYLSKELNRKVMIRQLAKWKESLESALSFAKQLSDADLVWGEIDEEEEG